MPRSVPPMGNVTKYLQKLGMGVYDNENQPGVSKTYVENGYKLTKFDRLLGLYGESLP